MSDSLVQIIIYKRHIASIERQRDSHNAICCIINGYVIWKCIYIGMIILFFNYELCTKQHRLAGDIG